MSVDFNRVADSRDNMASPPVRLRVGILGAGLVAQTIHLPNLSLVSHLYKVTAICDISQKNVDHCASKFHIPHATTNAEEIFKSPNVDVVFILTSDEFHEPYVISAIEAGKHVLVEKPLSLSIPSAQRIIDASKKHPDSVVFVGYMRRYAKSFTQTFKREVATIPRILYARVRDFPGPNPRFVDESGTFMVENTKDIPVSAGEERNRRLDVLFKEAFPDQEVTEEKKKACRFFGSLGSHDISLMREAIGFPESVAGVAFNEPFYNAIFNFRNRSGGKEPYSVTYESGIDEVFDFDAHVAVYGENKRVFIQYDSPFVKGLPIKVTVQENNQYGEFESREVLGSYVDAFTEELQELYDCVVNGKEVKTTVEDAIQDLRIYDMMYKKWNEQGSGR
ncbi:Myo-inositol 2-dehydrogenase [Pseudocercospora fuligena]|uniref:Myo-inositol 2-dehydrogenase n=1 Tax=Pseudocercospora fuligena TaxID=685502 RepID=A0A8H6R930_9PEZI|nr:Myo-inositol 2-dehydrogenase [Pseudocercospora fuligena]